MALPKVHRFTNKRLMGSVASVSSTSLIYLPSPISGQVIEVGAVLGSVASTADATVTTNINGTAITTGVVTITQSGSAAGNLFTANPTAARSVVEGDIIGFVFSGTGTVGGPVVVYADIRPGV